jgi:putative NADH-flavin reductase
VELIAMSALTIFGGTGPTGQLLVRQALDAGHEVTAFARNPAKLPQQDRLRSVEGQLHDTDAIAKAVEGADAVLSLLGPSRNAADTPPLVVGTRNIIDAMHAHGVPRLVAVGTPSITDPGDGRDLLISLMVKGIATFQPVAYRAIVDIGRLVRESGLKWTIVRVPWLTDGPRTPRITVRAVGDKGGVRLSRANAAAYFVEQATDLSRVGQAPLISDT